MQAGCVCAVVAVVPAWLLPLLLVSALPDNKVDQRDYSDLAQDAIKQIQDEQRGVDESINALLENVDILTDALSAHLTLDDESGTQDVEDRDNLTHRLLDKLEELDCVHKAHDDENLQLKEENAYLKTQLYLVEKKSRSHNNGERLEKDNQQLKANIQQVKEDAKFAKAEIRKVQADARLVKEENIQLKKEIQLVEEEYLKTLDDIRLLEEEIRVLKADIQKAEEDAKQVKGKKRELELAEMEAQERDTKASKRIAELERMVQQLQEMNNKTESEKRLVEDQLPLLKKEKRDVEDQLSLLQQSKKEFENHLLQFEKEKREIEDHLSLMEDNMRDVEDQLCLAKKEKKIVEDQLSVVEDEVRNLRAGNTTLNNEVGKKAQQIISAKNEMSRIDEKEHQECKRSVHKLFTRAKTAKDCAELYCRGARMNGVYVIKPDRKGQQVSAWCDMTSNGGGWTVFIKRDKKAIPQVSFAKDWTQYKTGFGNISTEYWLGLEWLYQLTKPSPQTLLLSATNMHGEPGWAIWSIFRVKAESTGFQLLVNEYQEKSTMGDQLVQHLNHSDMRFSTHDRDHDRWSGSSCARIYGEGGGWWYRACSWFFPTTSHGNLRTYYWKPRADKWVYLSQLQMMVRPQIFPACRE
nr:angiopoietin-2-like [Procambarus clarkii]